MRRLVPAGRCSTNAARSPALEAHHQDLVGHLLASCLRHRRVRPRFLWGKIIPPERNGPIFCVALLARLYAPHLLKKFYVLRHVTLRVRGHAHEPNALRAPPGTSAPGPHGATLAEVAILSTNVAIRPRAAAPWQGLNPRSHLPSLRSVPRPPHYTLGRRRCVVRSEHLTH